MPTQSEFKELRQNCTWTWTTQNYVYGYKVTGSNGNWIFLPAAGIRNRTILGSDGSIGYYWSSTSGPIEPSDAYYLFFLSSNINSDDGNYRYCGQSVRPVTE